MIDFHVHYNKDYPLIDKACIFPFCEEIYERNNPDFEDSKEWKKRRQRENEKNIGIENTVAFLFLWNDFNITNIEKYRGIKVHRHWDEGKYDWETKKAKKALSAIRDLKLPVIIEDIPDRTIKFVREYAKGINVVIPHLYNYNDVRDEILGMSNVYVDTSLALDYEILDYIKRFGSDRMVFGSDYPYGEPKREALKILKLPIPLNRKMSILNTNVLQLVKI